MFELVSGSAGFFERLVASSPLAEDACLSCLPSPIDCTGSLGSVSTPFAFEAPVPVSPFSPELLLNLESEPCSCTALVAATRNFFLKSMQRASAFSRNATSSFNFRSSSRFFASSSLFLSLYRLSAHLPLAPRESEPKAVL